MRFVAAILAAGRGTRLGADKVRLSLGGKPVWRWSFETFLNHPQVDGVILVSNAENIDSDRLLAPEALTVVLGGESRKDSSEAAVSATDANYILIHDAARPFVGEAEITRVIEAVLEFGAAAACMPVTDTIKLKDDSGLVHLDRSKIFAMQTPQGASRLALSEAHCKSGSEATDDVAMLQGIGEHCELVAGSDMNFKITTLADFQRAQAIIGAHMEYRTGLGYDIHAFSNDPKRVLWLGGVAFPDHPALDGHSDADALLHAITDALLGGAALGDIGQHFPNTDARWSGEPSCTFLSHAANLLRELNWEIVHIDATVIAESPKVMKKASEIREAIANAIGIDNSRVSVKATTNEKLGSLGRSEGIAAYATATIRRQSL